MYARQRVLLDFLLQASRCPKRHELVKWLFLARHESDVASRIAFYDFLPHQDEPFSFTLNKDLAALREEGYLADKVLKVLPVARAKAKDEVAGLTRHVRDCVSFTLDQYGDLPQDELTRLVYDRHPWYAHEPRSEPAPHEGVDEAAEVAVYTVGYEGRTIDAFLDHLMRNGIKRVIDVRRNPFSRKYGFTRRMLENLCAKVNIDYAHFPQVGVPSQLRKDLSTEKAYRELFRHYEKAILPKQLDTVAEISELMKESPSALLCFEAHHTKCHREPLSQAVAKKADLEVHHL